MKRVAACVDLSQYTKTCLAYSFYFSKKLGVPLYLLHVVRPVEVPVEPEDFETIIERFISIAQEQAENELKAYKEEIKRKGAEATIVARVGHPVEEILEFIDDIPTLAVVAPHNGGFLRSIIGGVAEKIARKSPFTVAVVKSNEDVEIGNVSIDRAVVAVDFSEDSRKALEFALKFVRKENVKLIHVFKKEMIKRIIAKLEGQEDLLKRWEREAGEKLQEWMESFGVDGKVIEGDPSVAILEEAYNYGAHAIFMGAKGLSSKRIMMGRLTEKVLKSSQIPVLVVR